MQSLNCLHYEHDCSTKCPYVDDACPYLISDPVHHVAAITSTCNVT